MTCTRMVFPWAGFVPLLSSGREFIARAQDEAKRVSRIFGRWLVKPDGDGRFIVFGCVAMMAASSAELIYGSPLIAL